MSKQGKRKKNLLKLFEDIDNETLSKYLDEEIHKYYVLKKSNELAREILKKYNITTYRTLNDYKFHRYEILLELATLRNITIPSYDSVEVSDIDIIFQIEEYHLAEIGWYEEFNYMLFSKEEEFQIEDYIPNKNQHFSYERIMEINKKYDSIILKEFGKTTKALYEQQKKEYLSRDIKTMYKEFMPISVIPKVLTRKEEVKKLWN